MKGGYNTKHIEAILEDYQKFLPFLSGCCVDQENCEPLAKVSRQVTAPVVFSFVWWVLCDAQRRGIQRLYFLARDGVILCRIAQLFCERFDLTLDCRCLYCSRASLRLPTFHFIGDEAYELLFLGGYNVTPFTLLQRLGFSQQEREELYASCSMRDIPEHASLSNRQIADIRRELEQNGNYNRRMNDLSVDAYPSAVGYLRQEGLLSGEAFAVVDSGWTGTMQRSLRQLVEHEQCTADITGYYFGMFKPPQDDCDGQYLTWYFDSSSHRWRKTLFCNNLLECMLSEPCGMTVGYRQQGGVFVPVYGNAYSGETLAAISLQQQEILSFAQRALERIDFDAFDAQTLLSFTEDVLTRLMAFPTQEQALAYRDFAFSDDVLDNTQVMLLPPNHAVALRHYSLPNRVFRRVTGSTSPCSELFWAAGSAALLPSVKRRWYQFSILAWEWMKYRLK